MVSAHCNKPLTGKKKPGICFATGMQYMAIPDESCCKGSQRLSMALTWYKPVLHMQGIKQRNKF